MIAIHKMRKYIVIFLVLLSICTSVEAQNRTRTKSSKKVTAVGKNDNFYSRLDAELLESNKNLPQEINDGAWIKRVYRKNKEIIMECSVNSFYSTENMYLPAFKELANVIAKELGPDLHEYASRNIVFKIRVIREEDNSVLYETTSTPEDYLKADGNFSGHMPLSAYKKAFEAQNAELPQTDEYGTFAKVEMIGQTVYYDYYIDALLCELAEQDNEIIESMKEEIIPSLKSLISMSSQNTRDDFSTYGIKFCYRYYNNETLKYSFSITINPATDLR